MAFEIAYANSRDEVDAVYDGDAPHYHPDEFWKTRLREKRVLIAKDNSKNIGLLCYTAWWGNTPFLELVEVQKNFQRRGIARALLEKAASDITEKKFKTLISSCETTNELSHLFHQGMGFNKLGSLDLPHGGEQFYSIQLDELS